MNRDNDKGKVLLQRSLIMACGMALLLLGIVFRLYYLQVYQADQFKMLADENRISTRLIIPQRGIIYDRNGEILATNEQNFQVMIVAEQTANVQDTLDALKKIMPLSPDEEKRVKRIAKMAGDFCKVCPKLSIAACAQMMQGASFVVGVDTGLTHLAAATAKPTVGLFLDYPVELVGLTGARVKSLGGVGANPEVAEVCDAIAEASAQS